jgi:photosystem I subunit XI
MTEQLIKPYKGDPFVGHLSTPISDSGIVNAFIQNLPAYRKGLSPILRGLEVGLAHGYFVLGPWAKFGPLRDSDVANLGALVSGLGLVLIASICLGSYGLATFQKPSTGGDSLQTAEGWSQFTSGFFVGGMASVFFAYFLLENFGVIDGIMTGLFN